MVGLNGLEPTTSPLSGVRSNHLSYRPMSIELLNHNITALPSCQQKISFFHPIRLSVCTERSLTGTGNKMVDVWQEDGKHRQKHPRFVRKGRCRNDRDGKRERTSGMSGRAARLCHRWNMGERWGLAGMYRWDATSFADGAWHTGAGGRSVWKTVKCWSIMS